MAMLNGPKKGAFQKDLEALIDAHFGRTHSWYVGLTLKDGDNEVRLSIDNWSNKPDVKGTPSAAQLSLLAREL